MENIYFQGQLPFDFSLEDLPTIFDPTCNIIIVVDKKGLIVLCNNMLECILGVASDSIIGKNIEDLSVHIGLMDVIKTGKPQVGKRIIVKKKTFINDMLPIIKNETVLGAVSIIHNLDRIYSVTEKQLSTILDSTYNGIIAINTEGIITICNKSAERILGKSVDKVLGVPIVDILSNTGLMEIIKTGVHQIGKKMVISNRYYITNRAPIINEGKLIGAVGVFQDISDLDMVSRELKAVKDISKELDAIINFSYDGIYVTNGDGNTTRVNKAYERITGVMASEVIGRNMKELVKAGFYDQSVTLLVLEKREPITIMQEIKKNGKKIIVTGNPVFDQDGKIKYVVTNVRDITELTNLKNSLEASKNLSQRYFSELQRLRNQQLKLEGMIVVSSEMKKTIERVKRVSLVESTVLITGESGVGKENIAKLIHQLSSRAREPIITINCGAIPENLLESELFGYEEGAFTGAKREGKLGLAELAQGGTLFIDEVAELPFNMQVKILRLLQEKEFVPIGSSKIKRADIRFIAATNKDLKLLVKEKRFREDLYYRLNVIPIHVPPLRERKSDIIPLICHFVEFFGKKYNRKKEISSDALEILKGYPWPGNVRELENTIEEMVVISLNEKISVNDIPDNIREKIPTFFNYNKGLDKIITHVEKEIIIKALHSHNNIKEAALSLGIHRTTLLRKAKKYGISFNK